MTFTSGIFALFFLIVFSLYLALQGHLRWQNRLLLVASYVFYGYWDWRFLALLAGTSYLDYWVARWLEMSPSPDRRKRILTISIVANLAVLGLFKYFNFFADNLVLVLNQLGLDVSPVTLRVLLPVGISFYTFQSMSYTIDVFRRELPAVKRFGDFALYVSFFPQLVAGPIERATTLVPAVLAPRKLRADQIQAGLLLIALGYFKKMVVADNLAIIANTVFNDYTSRSGVDLLLGALAFTFQIYGDFSGYSDIARGLAKLMGFELMVNFRMPYFATSPSEFWQRWHISLSTWLRDYLYVPLGGNRHGPVRTYRNLMLTMLLGGLWHGAAWNFVLWGLFHGLLLVGYRLAGVGPRSSEQRSALRRLPHMLLMFCFTVVGWILFRAHSMHQIGHFFSEMGLQLSADSLGFGRRLVFFAGPLMALELYQERQGNQLAFLRWPLALRVLLLCALILWALMYGVREPTEFIYFQF
jgi:D-alanyl-lipoteichoic acid acyltransferase DltB (MBOAT superfamily)